MASLARRKSVSLPPTQSAVFRALDQRAGWRAGDGERFQRKGLRPMAHTGWCKELGFVVLPACNLGQRHILLSVS